MKNRMKVFSALVILLLSECLFAGVYKWTDERGNVHYGDNPSQQLKVKNNATELNIDTRLNSGITHSSGQKEKRDRMIQVLEEDRKERKAKQKKYYADKNKRLKRCARLKDRLRRYRDANYVYKLDKKGERVYYSAEDRARKEAVLQKKINKSCR